MMGKTRRGCTICESTNKKAYLCPNCANSTLFEDRRRILHSLQRQKEQVKQKLEKLLEVKRRVQEQQVQEEDNHIRLHVLRQRSASVKNNLEQGQQEISRLQTSIASRRAHLEEARAQLATTRSDVLHNQFPTLIRYQSLTQSHVQSMLLREQRSKIRQLLDIFPFKMIAVRDSGGPPTQHISIFNLRLPDNPVALSLSQQAPESTSAALGYLVLFLELLATYVGGPLLHEAHYQGSTTSLWQPHSFWDRQPSLPSSSLSLHCSPPSSNPISTQLNNISSRVRSSNSLWSLPSLFSAPPPPENSTEGYMPLSHHASTSAPLPTTTRPQYPEAKAAYESLSRSMICFLQDKTHALNVQLQVGSSVVQMLYRLCFMLKKDLRPDGALAASALGGDAGSIMMAGTQFGGFANTLLGPDYDYDEEDIDGWDFVRAPSLPPPPSQPDEVEHWTRAMITDASGAMQNLPGSQVQDRLKSLFQLQFANPQ